MPISPDESRIAADSAEPDSQAPPQRRVPQSGTRLLVSLAPELAVLVACVVGYIETIGLTGNGQGPGPAMYPRILIGLLALTMLGRVATQVLQYRRDGTVEDVSATEEAEVSGASLPLLVQAIALSVGFVVATVYLGWVLSTFLFVPLFCWVAGRRNLFISVPLGAVFALGSAYVFVQFVYIALPTGVGIFDELTVDLYIALGIY